MTDEVKTANMEQVGWNRLRKKSVGRLFLVVAALTMGACSFMNGLSNVDIGVVEFGGFNKANVRFGTLNSTKRWHEHLDAGQALE